jgi:hypothetical protein
MHNRGVALALFVSAAAVLTNSGSASPAANLSQLGMPQALPGEVFPTVSDPHLFRQRVLVKCGADSTCVFKFDKIEANRLLQIDTISCAASGNLGDLFKSPEVAVDAAHLIGVFPLTDGVGAISGPFYVAAGERPTIATNGTEGESAFCAIFGTLWSTA